MMKDYLLKLAPEGLFLLKSFCRALQVLSNYGWKGYRNPKKKLSENKTILLLSYAKGLFISNKTS